MKLINFRFIVNKLLVENNSTFRKEKYKINFFI